MSRMGYRLFLLAVAMLLAAGSGWAAEGTQGEKVQNFFQRLLNTPVNIGKKTTEKVVETGSQGTQAAFSTAKSSTALVSGNVEEAGDEARAAAEGVADTVKTAAVDTPMAPVQAADETWKGEAQEHGGKEHAGQ